MKSAILILAFILVNGVVLSQGTKNHIVYFATNSAELIGSEKEKLNQFFGLFDKSKITEIKLLGHTDSDGEDKFNVRLSENRSKAVRRFLLIHGLKSSNEESFGEKKPVLK